MASEYKTYYDEIARNSSTWAHPRAALCGCRGGGWWISEVDTMHECPYHYSKDQPHPDDAPPDDAPPRMVVGERFGTPIYAPIEDDDIPF